MKLFFYKSILIFVLFLTAFHFSFGYLVKKVKTEFNSVISKEQLEKAKNKIRDEMQNAVKKDSYIKTEDAIIINKFINKIKSDLEKNR
tara:strand:- start:1515 stop:1778 length:264 start_codon:yes stop_codon:yes gene_type:complete